MTVGELKEILNTFPDNMNVMVTYDTYIRNIDMVDTVVDIDTDITSVDIIAKREYP